jgi:putative sigma-54 modulation protein
MNVSYKGLKQTLPEKIQSKLDVKFAKLSKLLEQRGEREAHVIVRQERHLNNAEITIQFYDHQLVAAGSDGDLFTALSEALQKLETQALKQRGRWREKHRREDLPQSGTQGKSNKTPRRQAAAVAPASKPSPDGPRVFRPNHHERRKPITLEEALLLMDKTRDYLVYRDAERETLSVLVRRRDGNFDLIEA